MKLAKVFLITMLLFWSEFLGYRYSSWGSFGLSNFGWYSIVQLIFAFLGVILLFRNTLFRKKVILLYLFLFFTLVFSVFINGSSLSSAITNFSKIKFVLQLPIIIFIISNLRTEYIIKFFNKFSLISIYMVLIQMFLYKTNGTVLGDTTIFVESTILGRTLRMLSPLNVFVIFSIINLNIKLKNTFSFVTLLNLILAFTAVVFIGHRNLLILTLILSLYIHGKIKLSILIGFLYILYSSISLLTLINSTNILDFSALSRLGHYLNTLDWLTNNWFGCFYDWEVYDADEMLSTLISEGFVRAPTEDSGWINLIIIYGFPGLIFVLLVIRSSLLNLSKLGDKYLQIKLFIMAGLFMSFFMALGLIGVSSGFFIIMVLIGLAKKNEIYSS
jgi:hypothetical protein